MLGYYNYSVILTYFGLASSVLGMSFLFYNEPYAFIVSLILFMISGICDMFDGAIASRCKRSEEAKMFGIQIDSLCDLVCFGVFPGLITYRIGKASLFSVVAFVIIVLCSVIRLGYFNVQETLRDKTEKRELYAGLPVTLTSLFYPFMLLIGTFLKLNLEIYMPIVLFVMAGCEISKLPIKKPYGAMKVFVVVFGLAVFASVIIFRERIIGAII